MLPCFVHARVRFKTTTTTTIIYFIVVLEDYSECVVVSLFIHEKKKKKPACLFLKEHNMAGPFLQHLIENISDTSPHTDTPDMVSLGLTFYLSDPVLIRIKTKTVIHGKEATCQSSLWLHSECDWCSAHYNNCDNNDGKLTLPRCET